MPETVTVYFDYLCPFAWRAAEVCELIAQPLQLEFDWRHFSLYQSNYNGNANWQLWNEKIEADSELGCKGLLPFLASCAARKQGEDKYNAFRLAIMRARHVAHRPLDMQTLRDVATHANLHIPQFESELANPECRTLLAKEHHQAAALHVFGTPTFKFSSGHTAYFRIKELPKNQQEAINLFNDYRRILECYPYLETVKRPRAKGN